MQLEFKCTTLVVSKAIDYRIPVISVFIMLGESSKYSLVQYRH